MLEFELLAQFLFGIVGALVIIYLRVYEALPRMSGATMIKDRSLEADQLSQKWHSLAVKSENEKNTDTFKELRDDYQQRESEIRKEIRSMKFKQWTLTASLYIILGGFFALVVFPLISEEKILLDGIIQPIEALKCMGIGFTWTTYISLLESRNPEKEAREIRDRSLEELKKKKIEAEQKVKDLEKNQEEIERKNAEANKKVAEAEKNANEIEKKVAETTKRYDEIITSLNKDFQTYKEATKKLIGKYKDLLGIE